jgi:propionate CoA-transferase
VGHVSLSGPRARAQGQEVICVTERAVFQLRPDGIELIEVADEVEVQRDVVERMGFKPIVGEVKRMPLE